MEKVYWKIRYCDGSVYINPLFFPLLQYVVYGCPHNWTSFIIIIKKYLFGFFMSYYSFFHNFLLSSLAGFQQEQISLQFYKYRFIWSCYIYLWKIMFGLKSRLVFMLKVPNFVYKNMSRLDVVGDPPHIPKRYIKNYEFH
jgi:hypothetical protein